VFDYEDLDRAFGRSEFQAELLRNGGKDVRAGISHCDTVGGMRRRCIRQRSGRRIRGEGELDGILTSKSGLVHDGAA
jgi:hypothetical protein